MSYYHLFVKSRCPYCKEAKELLKSKKIEHVVTSMDKAPSVLDRLKVQLEHQTVPIIFEVTKGEKYNLVGGCQQLKESFANAEKVQESTGEVGEESNVVQKQHDATAHTVSTDSTGTVESTDA